jgi:hypothetical protein
MKKKARIIKFRAKEIETNEFVYGDLIQGKVTKIVNKNGEFKVDKNTVKQLAGFDAAGEEIYEGDKIKIYSAFCCPAEVLRQKKPYAVGRVKIEAVNDKTYEDINSPFDYQVLKYFDSKK